MITAEDVAAFEECISGGGIAVFPTDTLYGIGCRPDSDEAIARVYGLKGRAPDKPAAVMYFTLDSLPPIGPRTRGALDAAASGAGAGRACPAGWG